MTINEMNQLLAPLGDRLEAMRIGMDRLEFCLQVHDNYVSGNRPANEHMDADKARAQLREAVSALIIEWRWT